MIGHLKAIQFGAEREVPEKTPFPFLEPLSRDEVLEILKTISMHKALTEDLISDVLLEEENMDRTADVLKDL